MRKVLFLIFILTSISSKYFQTPLNLYISDRNYTQTVQSFMKSSSIIGILFTNKKCLECHETDHKNVQIIEKINEKYQVKLFRSELVDNPILQQQLNIKRFPMLHFIIKIDNNPTNTKNYINNQIVTLSNVQMLVAKLRYYLEIDQKIDIKNQILLKRQQLNLDLSVIKFYGTEGIFSTLPLLLPLADNEFNQLIDKEGKGYYSHCNIFIEKNIYCDEISSTTELQMQISRQYFNKVNEFTEPIFTFYKEQNYDRYVFVVVIDSIFNRQRSVKELEMLESIIVRNQFRDKVTIFWMETQINRQKLIHLGFNKTDRPPLFAYFDLANPVKQILTQNGKPVFDKQHIMAFMRQILKTDDEKIKLKLTKAVLMDGLSRYNLKQQYDIVGKTDNFGSHQNLFLLVIQPFSQTYSTDIYQIIKNFDYFKNRILLFTRNVRVKFAFSFEKIQCGKKYLNGLFVLQGKGKVCHIVSQEEKFHLEYFQSEYIINQFNLPPYFWIEEFKMKKFLNSNNIRIHRHKIITFLQF